MGSDVSFEIHPVMGVARWQIWHLEGKDLLLTRLTILIHFQSLGRPLSTKVKSNRETEPTVRMIVYPSTSTMVRHIWIQDLHDIPVIIVGKHDGH